MESEGVNQVTEFKFLTKPKRRYSSTGILMELAYQLKRIADSLESGVKVAR